MNALAELYEKRSRLRSELDAAKASYRSSESDGVLQRLNNLKVGLSRVEREILDAASGNARQQESGVDLPGIDQRQATAGQHGANRDAALRVVEERSGDLLSAAAADRLDSVIRTDLMGADARYVTAIASPAYLRAFGKLVFGAAGAAAVLEREEAEAVNAVARSMHERALLAGTGELGGYAVPLSLDPTVLLTSDGAVNPIRQLATVSTIATTTWQGVSSKGVEAEFAAEAEEAEDGSPEFAQPEVRPERCQIWVPYSIELGEDWTGLGSELARLFADARDVKEAEVFATGKGAENIPQGLITGATETVTTAGSKVVAADDIYGLQEDLGARWQPRATWLGSNAVANEIYRLTPPADPENPPLMSANRDAILGKRFAEVSTMSSKTTTEGELILAYGDIAAGYRIVDRLGMRVETVQTVFGAGGKPTGQRGAYAFFRVGAKVIVPEALRALKIKP